MVRSPSWLYGCFSQVGTDVVDVRVAIYTSCPTSLSWRRQRRGRLLGVVAFVDLGEALLQVLA